MLPGSESAHPRHARGAWGQFRGRMGSVKTPSGVGTVATRIRLIRQRLNPNGAGPLGWPEFATFVGRPLGTVKKWEARSMIDADLADELADRLSRAGLSCSGDWIRKGTKPAPQWADTEPHGGASKRSAGKGALVREPESAHFEHRAEEPGWLFGDPSEAEEQFRTALRNIERTHRAMVGDPAAFPADE